MKETPKCAGCSYMGWPVPRRTTGNNRHLDGPRSSCMCRHPEAVASFRRVCPKSPRLEAFIGFTKPGGKTPVIKTSPRWCPLREGNGGHVRESFKGVSD